MNNRKNDENLFHFSLMAYVSLIFRIHNSFPRCISFAVILAKKNKNIKQQIFFNNFGGEGETAEYTVLETLRMQ